MITTTLFGLVLGVGLAALLTLLFGVYTIGPTERGVLSTFGRAQRTTGTIAVLAGLSVLNVLATLVLVPIALRRGIATG